MANATHIEKHAQAQTPLCSVARTGDHCNALCCSSLSLSRFHRHRGTDLETSVAAYMVKPMSSSAGQHRGLYVLSSTGLTINLKFHLDSHSSFQTVYTPVCGRRPPSRDALPCQPSMEGGAPAPPPPPAAGKQCNSKPKQQNQCHAQPRSNGRNSKYMWQTSQPKENTMPSLLPPSAALPCKRRSSDKEPLLRGRL